MCNLINTHTHTNRHAQRHTRPVGHIPVEVETCRTFNNRRGSLSHGFFFFFKYYNIVVTFSRDTVRVVSGYFPKLDTRFRFQSKKIVGEPFALVFKLQDFSLNTGRWFHGRKQKTAMRRETQESPK